MRHTVEFSTVGFDPALQLIGSSPLHTGAYTGMVIPEAPSTSTATRYLYALAGFVLSGAQRARIRGIRQLVTLGATVFQTQVEPPIPINFYPVEQPISTPTWRFPDGNISWHLLKMPPQFRYVPSALNGQGQLYLYAQQNALVFQSLAPYVAPWKGQLPAGGRPLVAGLGQFYDLRFPWESAQAWRSVDIPIEGPGTYVLWASVWQTDPSSRPTLGGAGTPPTLGLPPEENFILATAALGAAAIYKRIAGSLILEEGRAEVIPIVGTERKACQCA